MDYILPKNTSLHKGRYIIQNLLGKPGGFGITYRCEDTNNNKYVAIKELFTGIDDKYRCVRGEDGCKVIPQYSPEKFSQDKNNFIKEYKMIASFEREEGIVKIFDFFEENNTCYLVMDLIEGETLKEYVKASNGLSESESQKIIISILTAVQKIHQKEILHRDLKPVNVLIDIHKKITIIDFGVAHEEEYERKRNHIKIKSKGYSAPELEMGKICGKFTDVYSIGGILYYMLTNSYPPSASDIIKNHELSCPNKKKSNVSKKLNDIVHKSMMPKPEDRYQTCQQMLRALERENIVPKPSCTVFFCFLLSVLVIGGTSVLIMFYPFLPQKESISIPTSIPAISLKVEGISLKHISQSKSTNISDAKMTGITKDYFVNEFSKIEISCFSSKGTKKIRFIGTVSITGLFLFRGFHKTSDGTQCKENISKIIQKPLKFEPAKNTNQKTIEQDIAIEIQINVF